MLSRENYRDTKITMILNFDLRIKRGKICKAPFLLSNFNKLNFLSKGRNLFYSRDIWNNFSTKLIPKRSEWGKTESVIYKAIRILILSFHLDTLLWEL